MYKQTGQNDAYPDTVDIWCLGWEVPEWLSDRARVKFIDGEGNKTIEVIEEPNGGFSIIDSGGSDRLVTTKTKTSIICFGDSKIFALTGKQFEILYSRRGG